MNAGFATFDVLKKHLLADSLVKDKQFDDAIKHLGLGIAARMEKLCNRKFTRVEDDQEIIPADRANFLLSRYPVEAVSLIELKLTDALGWVTQPATFINTVDLQSGIVMLPEGCDAGPYYAQVRFTYTGGFWWQTLGVDEPGYEDSAAPAGAALLPDEIRAAWLLQCETTWAKRDKLGLGLIDKPDAQTMLDDLKWSSFVRETLQPYIRYQMT